MIPFNKPYISGNEINFIQDAIENNKLSGDGEFTRKCSELMESYLFTGKCLLTTSCTDALEMSSILINIKEGDEIIIPSFTFVSTANAFVLRGAKIIFADSGANNPNVTASSIESLITSRTKAIVVVHYAGIACDMEAILEIANKHNIFLIEDAAQAIDSFYKKKPLGTFGHFATFSFHETKNIQCGEGGALIINDSNFVNRAEIIREKGTNRQAFFRGEVDKYGWMDLGSSFLPSEITAAFLLSQLKNKNKIQRKRVEIWDYYFCALKILSEMGKIKLPFIPEFASNNGHMFYILCESLEVRQKLIIHLKSKNVLSVFHYISLHKSDFYASKHDGRDLTNSDRYSDTLLRLPLYFDLSQSEQDHIIQSIYDFFR